MTGVRLQYFKDEWLKDMKRRRHTSLFDHVEYKKCKELRTQAFKRMWTVSARDSDPESAKRSHQEQFKSGVDSSLPRPVLGQDTFGHSFFIFCRGEHTVDVSCYY
jgi:hypothetical protein